MRLTLPVIAVLAVGAAMAARPAWADDLNPPVWRGQPGTTFEQWEFSTNNPASTPDLVYNPYGQPVAQAFPGTNQSWVDEWGGRQGLWPLSGTIEATIPNNPEPQPYKEIWVQLTWAKQVDSSTPVVWEKDSGVYGTLVEQDVLGSTGLPSPNDLWYHSTYEILLQPNPPSEVVKIDGTLVVDELVVDTICAPEPSTLALLVTGAMGFLAYAWRRRARAS